MCCARALRWHAVYDRTSRIESCTGTRICPHPQLSPLSLSSPHPFPTGLAPIPPRPHRLCPVPVPAECVPIPTIFVPIPIPIPVVQNFFNTMGDYLSVYICYTSNSASSQFTVQSMITVRRQKTNSAVLPQQISPLPRYYRELGPRPCGVTVNSVSITAE